MQDRFSVIMLYSSFTCAAIDKSFRSDSYRHSYTDLRWMCISLACEISQKKKTIDLMRMKITDAYQFADEDLRKEAKLYHTWFKMD